MTLRSGHGTGAGQPRVEVLPADEQPAPVPAAPVNIARRSDGTLADSESAKALGKRGGLARARRASMLAGLGIKRPPEGSPMAPYVRAAEEWLTEHMSALASTAGGHVGPGPASIVASAAMQLAMSRYLADQGIESGDGDMLKKASALANDSRQNLLAAYELAVREAEARDADGDDLAARQADFQRRLASGEN